MSLFCDRVALDRMMKAPIQKPTTDDGKALGIAIPTGGIMVGLLVRLSIASTSNTNNPAQSAPSVQSAPTDEELMGRESAGQARCFNAAYAMDNPIDRSTGLHRCDREALQRLAKLTRDRVSSIACGPRPR